MKLIIEFPPFGGLYEGHTILENLYWQKISDSDGRP